MCIEEENDFLSQNAHTIELVSNCLSTLSSNPYRLGIILDEKLHISPDEVHKSAASNGVMKSVLRSEASLARHELLMHANKAAPRAKRINMYTCFVRLCVESQDPSKKYSQNSALDLTILSLSSSENFNWEECERTITVSDWFDLNTDCAMFESYGEFTLGFFSQIVRPDVEGIGSTDVDWTDANLWGAPHKEELFFESIKDPPLPPLKVPNPSKRYPKIFQYICLFLLFRINF